MNELAARLASLCTGKTSEISLSSPLVQQILWSCARKSQKSICSYFPENIFSSYNRWDGCTNLVEWHPVGSRKWNPIQVHNYFQFCRSKNTNPDHWVSSRTHQFGLRNSFSEILCSHRHKWSNHHYSKRKFLAQHLKQVNYRFWWLLN